MCVEIRSQICWDTDSFSVVKYLKGRNNPINDLEGHLNIESDCEDAYTVFESETLETMDEEEVHALWPLAHFQRTRSPAQQRRRNHELCSRKPPSSHRCMGTILFTPLKSQGIDLRLMHIHENTGRRTASLLTEEHIRSRELGETIMNQILHARR